MTCGQLGLGLGQAPGGDTGWILSIPSSSLLLLIPGSALPRAPETEYFLMCFLK